MFDLINSTISSTELTARLFSLSCLNHYRRSTWVGPFPMSSSSATLFVHRRRRQILSIGMDTWFLSRLQSTEPTSVAHPIELWNPLVSSWCGVPCTSQITESRKRVPPTTKDKYKKRRGWMHHDVVSFPLTDSRHLFPPFHIPFNSDKNIDSTRDLDSQTMYQTQDSLLKFLSALHQH